MIVNYETMKAAFQGFTALFWEWFGKTPSDYEKVAMVVPSTGETENYDWLGDIPAMEEWLGDRVIKQLTGFKYSIINKWWSAAIEMHRSQFVNDKLGLIRPRIAGFGEAGKRNRDKLIFELLKGGFAALCYDGGYFFRATHAESGTNQSNTATAAYSKAAVETGIAAMGAFTSDTGVPLNITPNVLVVHPTNYLQALSDMNSQQVVVTALGSTSAVAQAGAQNAISTMGIQVVKTPYIESNDWFLLDTTKPVKPLILQINTPMEVSSIFNPESEHVFKTNKFLFGAQEYCNAGYGLWQLAYGSTGGS